MSASPEKCAQNILDTVPDVMKEIKTQMRSRRTPDLTIPQFRALVYVNRNNGVSLSEVADHLGLTPPSTSKLVDDLTKRGFLIRQEHPTDRRRIQLAVTPPGLIILEASRAGTLNYLKEKLKQTTPNDRDAIISAMETLRSILQTSK